jgi:hypothetical protein
MKIYKITIALIVTLTGFAAHAQVATLSSDSVQFNSSGYRDMISSEVEEDDCQFIVYQNSKVEWVQGNGSFIMTFNVTSAQGDLDNLSQSGSATLNFTVDQQTGELQISKDTDGISIRLKLHGGTSEIDNSYTIASFVKL